MVVQNKSSIFLDCFIFSICLKFARNSCAMYETLITQQPLCIPLTRECFFVIDQSRVKAIFYFDTMDKIL